MRFASFSGVVATFLLLGAAFFAPTSDARRSRDGKPRPIVVELEDGLTLVVVPMPGAHRASLRVAVAAGSLDDPLGKEGLAHLVQHAVLEGSYHASRVFWEDEARAAGATSHAWTTPGATFYALDAPKEGFLPLAASTLKLLTNPALQLVDLDRVRKVMAAEPPPPSDAALADLAVSQALAPSERVGHPVLGAPESWERASVSDVVDFYARHYTPANAVVVVAGDLTLPEARQMVEEAVLWPPLPDQPPPKRSLSPRPAAKRRFLGAEAAVVIAYPLAKRDAALCHDAARLFDLRLFEALTRKGRARSARAMCRAISGHGVVALVVRSSFASRPEVLRTVDEVIASARAAPANAAEERLVQQRAAGQRAVLLGDPSALADELAQLAVSVEGDREYAVSAHWQKARIPARALWSALVRALVPERRVVVEVAPALSSWHGPSAR